MESLVAVVRLAMASVFLWAGLEKARSPMSVASTMRRLGLPPGVVRAGVPLLIAGELAVAVGLIFVPGTAATACGVLALSTAFAVAGLVALAQDEQIPCDCFGVGRGGNLGMSQVLALPLWLAGAATLWLEAPASSPFREGSFSLALVGLTIAALRSVAALRVSSAARGDRQSAEEMSLWLRD